MRKAGELCEHHSTSKCIETICDDFSTIPLVFFVFFVFFVFRADYWVILTSYLQLRLHFGANLLHFGADLLHFGADLLHFGELSTSELFQPPANSVRLCVFFISYILGLTSYILGGAIFSKGYAQNRTFWG